MRNLYASRCSNINLECLGNQRNLQELRLKSVSGIHLTTTLTALKQLSSLKHLVCILLCGTHISTECHSVVFTCHCMYICQGVSHAQNAKNAIQYKHTSCGRKVMRLATLCTNRQCCCLPLHMAVRLTPAVDSVQV